ncbi:MAG: VOC family protein [Spirochaetes bacterium]|nr:VOC family protein [Spirochaetota bacterium]
MLTIHHICIQTDVYSESKNFYMSVLQFKLINETPNFHGRQYNSWLKLGTFMIELQTNKNGELLSEFNKNSKGIVHFCLYTEDFDMEYNRIKETANQKFRQKDGSDIYSVNGGRLFKLVAPEGTIIEIRDMNDI